MVKTIAGIGSRKTPSTILIEMERIGKWCRDNNITVYSGHADGADYAFEKGTQELCTAYLPWSGFNSNLTSNAKFIIYVRNQQTVQLAKQFHPAYDKLSFGAKKLIERNGWQVLGENLNSPVDAIVCWTDSGKFIGGTSQALRIAKRYNIPIFNMFYEEYNTMEKVIEMLTKEIK